ncbi:MAG: AmmeMemoRadiSam system protein A [Nitrospinae bacterium]|nr:AmmeMemoRadiSam system protein A [Nitrospinota bacterium]
MDFTLTDDDKRTLLRAARDSIASSFKGSQVKAPEPASPDISKNLATPCGAFVTLTKHGDLRGCIGYVEAEYPLYETVVQAAKAAAFQDSRFAPVTMSELEEVEIEISALTPPHTVASYCNIEIGRHGIIMSKHGRRALFLPQVASERGWDIATTLTHLAMKAGISPDGWREGAQFEVFEALVFGEES